MEEDALSRLTWPLAIAVGSVLAWALVRVIRDPALRRSMVGPRTDEPYDPQERALLLKRLDEPTVPLEDAFPEVGARR